MLCYSYITLYIDAWFQCRNDEASTSADSTILFANGTKRRRARRPPAVPKQAWQSFASPRKSAAVGHVHILTETPVSETHRRVGCDLAGTARREPGSTQLVPDDLACRPTSEGAGRSDRSQVNRTHLESEPGGRGGNNRLLD
jgi:hypothetical protein